MRGHGIVFGFGRPYGWKLSAGSAGPWTGRRILSVLGAVLLILSCAGACHRSASLKEFRSEEGKFSVSVPTVMTETTYPVESEGYKFDVHAFNSTDSGEVFLVTYFDGPESAKEADAAILFPAVREGMMGKIERAVVSVPRRVSLDGHPGEETTITGRLNGVDCGLKIRSYMVGRRIYQAAAITGKDRPISPRMNEYLKSFTLTH